MVRQADDNSCLFHCIAFLLDESQSPTSLRAAIVDYIKRAPHTWSAATLGKGSVQEYCSFIQDPRRWGGQVELAIFSEMFQSELSVTDVESGRVDVYGQGAGYSTRCYMLYTGTHFDAVAIDTDSGSVRAVPVPGAGGADAAVTTLAAQQRASGQYTDKVTMTLKCKQCGHIMHGDYEARSHSGASGHKEFVLAK